jgi:hypothetical protein
MVNLPREIDVPSASLSGTWETTPGVTGIIPKNAPGLNIHL